MDVIFPGEHWICGDILSLSKYWFSNYARVYSSIRNTIINGHVVVGYTHVSLTSDSGKSRGYRLHALIAKLFIGPKSHPGMTVDHIDQNPANNCVWNLRWATKTEQCQNRTFPTKTKARKAVYQIPLDGSWSFRWDDTYQAAAHFGIDDHTLRAAAKSRTTYFNYHWIYAEEVEFLEGETFYQIPGYLAYYISNKARVRLTSGRITYGSMSPSGYYQVGIIADGTTKVRLTKVHTLSAITFLGPCQPGMVVNHKSGVKSDNKPENLEYVTQSGNAQHAVQTGLRKPRYGSDNKSAIPVIRFDMDWGNPRYFGSTIEGAIASGNVGQKCNIIGVCKGKGSHQSAGGYRWKYANDLDQNYVAQVKSITITDRVNVDQEKKTGRGVNVVAVVRFNLDWSDPHYFGSIVEAAAGSGIKRTSQATIGYACKDKGRTAGGYRWQTASDYSNHLQYTASMQ